MKTITHWIEGKAYEKAAERTGDVFNPATGDVQAKVAFASPAVVDEAVESAWRASQSWRSVSIAKRTKILFAFRQLVDKHQNEIARLLTLEHGKVTGDALGEVNRGLVIPTTTIPVEVSRFTLDGRTAAVFGEVTVPPQIGWSVTAGLRLEETKKEFDRGQTVPGPGRFTAEKTFQAVLPKLSVSYALTNDTTATATFALGTKPGGWSAYTGNAALAGFRAEKTRAFEAGVDTSFDEKSFTIAGRVFLYDVRDYQIERSFNAQDYLVVNAPKARSQGAELELARRFSSEFTVTATLGWTDVELRQFTDPFTGVRYDGKRAPYTPEYEAHLGATYRAKGGLIAAAELVATGETFFDESENQAFAAGAHRVVNARLGYDAERWRVSFFGENITDEAYYSLIVPGVRHGTPGAPRRWGVEAVLKW